jgi:hypothetical protein
MTLRQFERLMATPRINILKMVLLGIPLALPLQLYIARFEHVATWKLQLAYLYCCSRYAVASTLAVAFIANSYVRISYAIFFGLLLTFWAAYQADSSIVHDIRRVHHDAQREGIYR